MKVGVLIRLLISLVEKGRLSLDADVIDADKCAIEEDADFAIGRDNDGQYIILRA